MQKSPNPLELTSLECTVCLQRFDAKTRIPKCLACGHSLCSDCVSKVTACPLCNQRFNRFEVNTNFSLLGYLEEKQGMSTICKCSNEPENYYCVDCKEITCDACSDLNHSEHLLRRPTLKTLGLRKAILELVDQHEAKREVASNEELIAWKEGWAQRIRYMQTWETNFIERKKQELMVRIEEAVKTYTEITQAATNKLLQRLDSICPPEYPPDFIETLAKKKLELLLLFENNDYKENPNVNQLAEDFLTTYSMTTQNFCLRKLSQKSIVSETPLHTSQKKIMNLWTICSRDSYLNF